MAMESGLSLAFFAVGLATQAGALMLARRSWRRLRRGGRTSGRVVASEAEWISSANGPGREFHFPVVTFKTVMGQEITFRSDTGEGRAKPVGTEVPVLYDPDNPSDATLGSFKALWLIPVVLSLFGMPFLLIGLFGLGG